MGKKRGAALETQTRSLLDRYRVFKIERCSRQRSIWVGTIHLGSFPNPSLIDSALNGKVLYALREIAAGEEILIRYFHGEDGGDVTPEVAR